MTFVSGQILTAAELNSALAAAAAPSTFTSGGTGAVTRTIPSKVGDVVSVLDYGADNTGVLDCTTAINNAITYVANLGGGTVFFPSGSYMITGTINVLNANHGIALIGSSRWGCKLNFVNNASDCVVVTGTSYSSPIYGFEMHDFDITMTGKTGGQAILLKWANRAYLSNLAFNNAYNGITVWGTNDIYFQNINIQGVTSGSGGWGFKYYSNVTLSERSDGLTMNGFTVNCLYSGADAFVVDGNSNSWNANNVVADQCNYGLHILNSVSSTSASKSNAFNNFTVSGASAIGVLIEAGSSHQFTNSQIINNSGGSGQGSADTYALRINPDTGFSVTHDIQFISCRIGQSKQTAAYVAANNVTFNACSFINASTTPSNTYPGIRIASPSTDVTITDCSSSISGSSSWSYGLQVDSGTTRVVENNNNWSNSVTKGILWNNTDSTSYCGIDLTSSTASLTSTLTAIPHSLVVTGAATLTAAQTLGGVLTLTGSPAASTLTLPTAAQLVVGLVNPSPAKALDLLVINTTSVPLQLAPGTGVSFNGNLTSGNYAIPANTQVKLLMVFDTVQGGSEAVRVFGSSNTTSGAVASTWTEIQSYTVASGTSTQQIIFSGTYRRWRISLQGISPSANSVMEMQVSINGGSSYLFSATYACFSNFNSATTPAASYTTTNSAGFLGPTLTAAAGVYFDGVFDLWTTSNGVQVSGRSSGWIGSWFIGNFGFAYSTAGAVNAVQVFPSTGTFSGTIILEGLP